MARNPFEVFGLSPEMVSDLPEKELYGLIKAMYRSLLKSFHPDVIAKSASRAKKNQNRAVEINLAFEALNLEKDPVAFRRHRKTFVARRPQSILPKLEQLAHDLILQKAREAHLADCFIKALLSPSGWFKEEPLPAGAVHFPPKNLSLGLLDVAINQNLKMVSWSLGSNYKQIRIDSEGHLMVKPVGRRRFAQADYIYLLGSIPIDVLDPLPILERLPCDYFKTPALNAKIGANGPNISVLNRINLENFKYHALIHLKPYIMERAYLFSLNRAEFAETKCLTLEGLVVKKDVYP